MSETIYSGLERYSFLESFDILLNIRGGYRILRRVWVVAGGLGPAGWFTGWQEVIIYPRECCRLRAGMAHQ